ncbi:MAG TPA: tetratricopeptide repeat protein [Fibrobacteria bacterium]|nr:tetratricopeptide repeat protein [Fibrobacteria bacterium]
MILGGCAQLNLLQSEVQANRGETALVSRKIDSARAEILAVNKRLSDVGLKSGDEVSRTRADLQSSIAQLTAEMQKIEAQLENNQLRMNELNLQIGKLRSKPGGKASDTGKAASGASPLVVSLQAAQDDFSQGRYDLAYRGFSEVAGRDSSGTIAPQAILSMGECRFAQSNWDEARMLYQRVVREYPQDPARCAAFFKLGLTYERQGSIPDRDAAWGKLQKTCPGSNEAQRASDLQTIK